MTGFVRHVMAGLIFLGVVLTYMLRVNLSVAILAMVNRTALAHESNGGGNLTVGHVISAAEAEDVCQAASNITEAHRRDGPFAWDQKTRGIILGSFFYGYVVTELPGGWLAYKFGAKWILGMGILWTSIFTLMTPLTIYLDLHILLALRVLEGLGEGVSFPCFHALFAQWVPPSERSRIPAMTFAGLGIGTVVAFPFSAALCDTEMGWPLVFYVFGAIGVLWSIIWLIFGDSSPTASRWIDEKERSYIVKSLEETVVEEEVVTCTSVPWVEIFKTPAMWALWISHVAAAWGWHTLITLLPTFFNEVLHLGIAKNGIVAAIPYLCLTVVSVTIGPLGDYILEKRCSVSVLRKVADSLAHIMPGIFLLLSTIIGCNILWAVVLMCLAVGFEGFGGAGGFANNLDVAGRYAGVTFGIANTFGSICGIVAPYIAGAITQGSTSMYRWRIVFGIVAGIYWVAALFYIIFAQGHTAEWALAEKEKSKKTRGPVLEMGRGNRSEYK